MLINTDILKNKLKRNKGKYIKVYQNLFSTHSYQEGLIQS